MSERRDIAEYVMAAVAGVHEYLGDVGRDDIMRHAIPEKVDWPPPRPNRENDRQSIAAVTRFYAFEQARRKLRSPRDRARFFLQIVAVSELAAAHGMAKASALGGSVEAAGKRAFREARVLANIERGLAQKLPLSEVFAVAGVSQATGYRYLKRKAARTQG